MSYSNITADPDLTAIQSFYKDSNILVTGGTGFLGKILLEKLLRSCPDISTIFLLVRNKKGKNLQERVDDIFDDAVFDKLREERPKFRHKVVGIGGDCSVADLGLSLQDRRILMDEVNIVFHVAATVRFDEKLKLAVAINIRSLQDMLLLAKEMAHLKCFMHVSTAFANCHQKTIDERIYPSPIDSRKLIMLTETIPEKIIDNITPSILDKWPNTYAFTKQAAEDMVRLEGQGLPLGIFRPAIVVSAYKEPIKGWINNLYGPTGVLAGAGTGLLRTLMADRDVCANIVPVDMCVNALIAAGWEVAENFRLATKETRANDRIEIPVYNYESSNDQRLTYGQYMDLAETHGIHMPSVKAIWYYSLTLQKSRVAYLFMVFFLHILPALLVDVAMVCMGKSLRLMKVYKKVHKFSNVITYFAVREWIFESKNVRSLLEKMSKKDRELFFFDLKQLDWDEFFKNYLIGVRVYLLQDPLDTLTEARTKWQRLYWAHQSIKFVVGFLLLRLFWIFLKYAFSIMF